jgi:hypothetical protein
LAENWKVNPYNNAFERNFSFVMVFAGAKTHANPGLIAQAEKSAQGDVILT